MWHYSAMERTVEQAFASDSPAERGLGRAPGLVVAALLLAALSFFLLPTAHSTSRSFVQINGVVVSVLEDTTVGQVAGDTLALARAGSALDLTGDVVGIGRGAAAESALNGEPVDKATALSDGAVLVVRHGGQRLEGISRKTQQVPFETVFEGKGAVVSLVQEGAPGSREIFRGDESGKQAAVFTVAAPQNAVIRRSGAASKGQKLVALTFDDGPGKYTQGVLDALADKNVPATFFVLGGNAAGSKDVIAQIKAAGHEVENHTWSHPILTGLSAEAIQREIQRTSGVIGGSRFLRPPYGTYNAAVTAAAAAVGHRLVLWTVDTLDWKTRNADAILAEVKRSTKAGAIILMHDGGADRSQTVAAIPRVVDWLFANGYSLTTVSKLLQS